MPWYDESLKGPRFVQLFGPVLQALRELGESASRAEVVEKVAELVGATDEELAERFPGGGLRFRNLVSWARFYLTRAGYIDSSRRGVWTLTEKGRSASLDHEEALRIFRQTHAEWARRRKKRKGENGGDGPEPPNGPAEDGDSWREEVLGVLSSMPPGGFERFCQRLLRECGFEDVKVLGRSGDGGIDGVGILQVNALVSFKVLFQCKRYQGSVGPSHVRDFRGAMQGRADKGIIITTGTFTADARREAVRDGVPPIELVDGDKLVDMIAELELGVVPVRAYRVDEKFFEPYMD